MVLAAGAAIAGILAGWGVASGLPGLLASVPAVLILGALVAQTRSRNEAPGETIGPEVSWPEIHVELARSRRHHRPMAILRFPIDADPDVVDRLTQRLRRFDRAWVAHGDLIVLLPETDRPAAERLAARVASLVDAHAPAGLAVFPEDGATSSTLMARLYGAPAVPPARTTVDGADADLPWNVIDVRARLVRSIVAGGRASLP